MNFKFPFRNKAKFTEAQAEEHANMLVREAFDDIMVGIEESAGSRISELIADDAGYGKLGDDRNEIPEEYRIEMVKQSRQLRVTDAMTGQSIRLYTSFGVGTGMNLTLKGEDETKVKKAEEVIKKFRTAPENKVLLNGTGQRDLSDNLLINGEIFFVFFTGPNGSVILRTVNSLQIKDIATDLEDEATPRHYRRETYGRRGESGQLKTTIYKDWNNVASLPGEWQDGEKTVGKLESSDMFHLKLHGNSLRGFPLVTAQIKWTRAYRSFMTSRVAIQQALARIIQNVKTKGGEKGVQAIKNVLTSTLASAGGRSEKNPAPAFGATAVHNKSVDVTQVKQETGAAAAKIDGAMLVANAGAAVSIFPHYYGHGESFRLATATAMENPMLKVFEAYRMLWVETWEQIFRYVLDKNDLGDVDLVFEINYPEIFPRALTDKIDAIKKTVEAFPGLTESEDFAEFALDEIGVVDSKAIVKAVDLTIPEPETNDNSLEATKNKKAIQKEVHTQMAKITKNE